MAKWSSLIWEKRADWPHLAWVVCKISVLWGLSNLGYFYLLPALGYEPSYNAHPVMIFAYFLFWAVVSALVFWKTFKEWLTGESRIWRFLRRWVSGQPKVWVYGVLSLGFAVLVWLALALLALMPALKGPALAPYTDLLLVTPWYFLPKSVDILMQQILIAAFLLEMGKQFDSLKKIATIYAVLFGGAHIVLFALSDAPIPHAVFMTTTAFLSALVAPWLILRVRGGFLFAYMLHLTLYILLAMVLHTWPPPGYVFSYL